MTDLPVVAICIPTYNQAPYLPFAVESALAQVGVVTHVWISDDASTDNTDEVLDKFSANVRVSIIRNVSNAGVSANTQLVMRIPDYAYVVRLDSDDILYPSYCWELVNLLERYPEAGIAHCAVDQINEHGIVAFARRLARRTGYQASRTALRDAVYGYKVAANICMFRKRALTSQEYLFDTEINFVEDWDFYVRLADAGFGNVYNSKVLAGYRVCSNASMRLGRKAAEILGITHVLCKTLEPSWQRRGWNCAAISAARKRFARVHLDFLRSVQLDDPEREGLIKLLHELAGEDFGSFMRSSPRHWLWSKVLGRLALLQRDLKSMIKHLICQ